MNKSVFMNETLIDKWLVARMLQIVLFCFSIGMGVAFFLNFTQAIKFFDVGTIYVNIPIASDWIDRVSKTYSELTGLTQVLYFAWLSVLLMVCVNLCVALPELKTNRNVADSLSGRRVFVRSAIHSRLYHTGFRILSRFRKDEIEHLDKTADQAFISMNIMSLGKQPALTYVLSATVIFIYFLTTSDAGMIDIYRRFVYIGYPLLIFASGVLLTEAALYIYAAIIGSFATNKTCKGR
jgi:hypothetical protein